MALSLDVGCTDLKSSMENATVTVSAVVGANEGRGVGAGEGAGLGSEVNVGLREGAEDGAHVALLHMRGSRSSHAGVYRAAMADVHSSLPQQ